MSGQGSNRPIRTLPERLRENGFDYTLVCRGKRSFIYAQHVTPSVLYYEVFKLKVCSRQTIMLGGEKIVIHPAERFPTNESFWVWAWSIRNFETAMMKFEELENNDN